MLTFLVRGIHKGAIRDVNYHNVLKQTPFSCEQENEQTWKGRGRKKKNATFDIPKL